MQDVQGSSKAMKVLASMVLTVFFAASQFVVAMGQDIPPLLINIGVMRDMRETTTTETVLVTGPVERLNDSQQTKERN
ncbi:hypothetical protein B5X24_HaOG205327 [Helicoverpa armigera]|uniref:Uncharacterized protein n=1 Tax=Helicoverpa armigera TaxID=29058 RepID=A0A2W1BQL8_HELAM|nr:hypothetical protein B5X24_HaOG205327 [Helicoverpa armigera]